MPNTIMEVQQDEVKHEDVQQDEVKHEAASKMK